jgi:hypothetical protein
MRRLAATIVVVLIAGAVGTYWWWQRRPADAPGRPIPGETIRTKVEVLNGTDVDGLARATTRLLRSGGIDVVSFGTASADTFSVTQILVRRGDTVGAVHVLEALGVGNIAVAENPELLLDVSVYLGRDAARLIGLDP